MSGRFILAIPSSGLSAAGVIIRGVIVAETRGRRRGEGGGKDGGELDGMVESGARIFPQGPSSLNLLISKSGQIGP